MQLKSRVAIVFTCAVALSACQTTSAPESSGKQVASASPARPDVIASRDFNLGDEAKIGATNCVRSILAKKFQSETFVERGYFRLNDGSFSKVPEGANRSGSNSEAIVVKFDRLGMVVEQNRTKFSSVCTIRIIVPRFQLADDPAQESRLSDTIVSGIRKLGFSTDETDTRVRSFAMRLSNSETRLLLRKNPPHYDLPFGMILYTLSVD